MNALARKLDDKRLRGKLTYFACCRLACAGLQAGDGKRARAWQLLLGYLPPDREVWALTQQKRRAEYASFCEDFMLNLNQAVRTSLLNRAATCLHAQEASTKHLQICICSVTSEFIWL